MWQSLRLRKLKIYPRQRRRQVKRPVHAYMKCWNLMISCSANTPECRHHLSFFFQVYLLGYHVLGKGIDGAEPASDTLSYQRIPFFLHFSSFSFYKSYMDSVLPEIIRQQQVCQRFTWQIRLLDTWQSRLPKNNQLSLPLANINFFFPFFVFNKGCPSGIKKQSKIRKSATTRAKEVFLVSAANHAGALFRFSKRIE